MSSARSFDDAIEDALGTEPLLLFLIDVGAVLEHRFLAAIQHLVLMDAVMILGGGGEDLLDKLSFGVGGDVSLVAVVALISLLYKRCFLITRGRSILPLPSFWRLADRGVNDLARRHLHAVQMELAMDLVKEDGIPPMLDQRPSKPTDGRLIGDVRIGGDAEELLEALSIIDLFFSLWIAESKPLLEQEDAEEDCCIKRLSSDRTLMEFRMPFLRERKINDTVYALQEGCRSGRLGFAQGKVGEGKGLGIGAHERGRKEVWSPRIIPRSSSILLIRKPECLASMNKWIMVVLQRFLASMNKWIMVVLQRFPITVGV